ncbi:G-protein coupled receptor 20 [Lampris incognitus]|uniref:G-protein coupled receptor 20 n=1 Tax=Lampris incognitus TaxID=2546036 RepID=UPI0024B49307|nr:G-protein coupled receptor 20 [Lampris incognitus]
MQFAECHRQTARQQIETLGARLGLTGPESPASLYSHRILILILILITAFDAAGGRRSGTAGHKWQYRCADFTISGSNQLVRCLDGDNRTELDTSKIPHLSHQQHAVRTQSLILITAYQSTVFVTIIIIAAVTMTNSSGSESWVSANTTFPVVPQVANRGNGSGVEPYLQRLVHLDEGLYNDFYGLWITLMVVNSMIFLVGMVLNTVALYVFCFRTKRKTTPVIYTINLAVTDLLVNLSLPTRILLYYSGGACLICSYLHIFSYFVNMYCSILFLTCICVDRYLAIVQMEASRRWRNSNVAKCVCVSVWLFAIVVTYSFLSTAFRHTGCCLTKLLLLTITEFFLPLIIIVAFTLRIMWALADRQLMQQSRERRRRAVQLLTTVLIIFTVCFTPFHIRQVLLYFQPDMPHHVIVYHLTVTLSSLNSCMDPVVYCFITNNFQATVRSLFRRAEAEQSSGDIISMQHSSKFSGGMVNAITNNVIMMADLPTSLRRNQKDVHLGHQHSL